MMYNLQLQANDAQECVLESSHDPEVSKYTKYVRLNYREMCLNDAQHMQNCILHLKSVFLWVL